MVQLLKVEPRRGDHYVAVDEIDDQRVKLVASPWPEIDRGGRLLFQEASDKVYGDVDVEVLQREVDEYRAEQGMLQRPLRIGDTLLIRGGVSDHPHWERVLDVTQAAREAAKRALFRAVAPPPQGTASPPAAEPPLLAQITGLATETRRRSESSVFIGLPTC